MFMLVLRLLLMDLFIIVSLFICSKQRFNKKKTIKIWIIFSIFLLIFSCAVYSWPIEKISFDYLRFFVFFAECIVLFAMFAYTSEGTFGKKIFIYMSSVNISLIALTLGFYISVTFFDSSILVDIIVRMAFYLVLFILYIKFFKESLKQKFISIKNYYWLFSAIPIMCFFLQIVVNVYPLLYLGDKNIDYELIGMIFLLNICIYYVIVKFISVVQKENNLKQIDLKNNLLSEQIKNYENIDKQSKLLRNNYKLYAMNLLDRAKQQNFDFIYESLNKYEDLSSAENDKKFCSNALINAILSAYIKKINTDDIKLNFDINMPEELNIDDIDIVSIVANTFENALNSCKSCSQKDKFIDFYMALKNNKLIIMVKNSCDDNILFIDGLPKASNGSGVGVISILASVKKYNGLSDFSVKDNVFICKLIFVL